MTEIDDEEETLHECDCEWYVCISYVYIILIEFIAIMGILYIFLAIREDYNLDIRQIVLFIFLYIIFAIMFNLYLNNQHWF